MEAEALGNVVLGCDMGTCMGVSVVQAYYSKLGSCVYLRQYFRTYNGNLQEDLAHSKKE